MDREMVELNVLNLVGITTRTNNKNELDPEKAKISSMAKKYWGQNIAGKFKHRKNPGITYAIYTEYETDEHGDYTYFIGEQVEHFDEKNDPDLLQLTIPEGKFQKFTTQSGKMPGIVISAWQEIWGMRRNELGGERAYHADFEVYDHRAVDPNSSVVDIYIGIK